MSDDTKADPPSNWPWKDGVGQTWAPHATDKGFWYMRGEYLQMPNAADDAIGIWADEDCLVIKEGRPEINDCGPCYYPIKAILAALDHAGAMGGAGHPGASPHPVCGHEKWEDGCVPCLEENVRRCHYWEGEARKKAVSLARDNKTLRKALEKLLTRHQWDECLCNEHWTEPDCVVCPARSLLIPTSESKDIK